MVWNRQYWITWFVVVKDHVAAFLAGKLITNFTEGLDGATTGYISKCTHLRKLWQVCLQNIPEQVRLEYAVLFLWLREAIHEWPHGYYAVHPLWSYLVKGSQEGWGIQLHSPGNQNHRLIQHEISLLSPPYQSIALGGIYVKDILGQPVQMGN